MDITTAAGIKPTVSVPNGKLFVNGVEVPRTAVAQEMQHHPALKPSDAWAAAARALAIRELLLQRAQVLGLSPAPLTDGEGRQETGDEALVRLVVEIEVVTPEPDDAACRRYYEQNMRRFRTSDLFEVDHILIAADPKDHPGRIKAAALAQTLLSQLQTAPDAFAALAQAHSACPSREMGGNLGQIGPRQTVPEFESALRDIDPGTIGAVPVETRYGFHIVRVNRRKDGEQLPYDAVAGRIADYLCDHVRHSAIRQYINVLSGQADIRGIDLAGSASPLVQ